MDQICISPLDDRYIDKTKIIKEYFSEFAFFRYRISVEIEYLISLSNLDLCEIPPLDRYNVKVLRDIYKKFDIDDYKLIKSIEKRIKHDVKSIEYFLREKLEMMTFTNYLPFIHFGLTSQDINNTAISISLLSFIKERYFYKVNHILDDLLEEKIRMWENVTMISRTHGQPAVPTRLGKEFRVFSYRIYLQIEILSEIKYYGKFGGASGNLNAHKIAYPEIDWISFGERYLYKFGLNRSKYTTQIDNYDNLSVLFDCLKRINTIFIDMCQDIWLYISMDYLKQKIVSFEVGSSTMPHKVNPINFENAEGNLKLANNLLEFFSRKLPVSRLQRDLTDSTVLRNLGVIFGHIYVAFDNIEKGLSKLEVNIDKINNDLETNYVVISEGIQTILRKHGIVDAYELLKDLTRNNTVINKEIIDDFIDDLSISESIKNELREITIYNYI